MTVPGNPPPSWFTLGGAERCCYSEEFTQVWSSVTVPGNPPPSWFTLGGAERGGGRGGGSVEFVVTVRSSHKSGKDRRVDREREEEGKINEYISDTIERERE